VFDGLYITGFNKPQAANAILNGKNAINISINAPSLCAYGSHRNKTFICLQAPLHRKNPRLPPAIKPYRTAHRFRYIIAALQPAGCPS
jgi:hypothetical protein